jgi:hypothetical protein
MKPHVGGMTELAGGFVLAILVRVGGSLEDKQKHQQGKAKRQRFRPIPLHVLSSAPLATYSIRSILARGL